MPKCSDYHKIVLILHASKVMLKILQAGLRQERICLQFGRSGFDPWVGKIPWRKAWQPTPVFLPGESPWTKVTGRLQSIGSRRVRRD